MANSHTEYTHAELAISWPGQNRGLDLPLQNTELVVSLYWWRYQQVPVHLPRSRVMDCVILWCWHCRRPEVEHTSVCSIFHCLCACIVCSTFSPALCQQSSLKPLQQQQCAKAVFPSGVTLLQVDRFRQHSWNAFCWCSFQFDIICT